MARALSLPSTSLALNPCCFGLENAIFLSSRSCFTYVRHPFISGHERQVRHTYIVVVGVRSLAAIDGSGSSFLMVSWVYGSASFRCGRSSGMFKVSISAVFALPRGEVLTGILL